MGQRSTAFICTQFRQNNYTNDLSAHYLIYFIRLSGFSKLRGQMISPHLWLSCFCNELYLRKMQSAERSKVIWQHISVSLQPPSIALCLYIFSLKSYLDVSKRLYSPFIATLYRWKKGVQRFREKWLVANIDCHCWERARGNEIRENRYISPRSIILRLLFALGPVWLHFGPALLHF